MRQLDKVSGGNNNPGGSQKGAGVRVSAVELPAFASFWPREEAAAAAVTDK